MYITLPIVGRTASAHSSVFPMKPGQIWAVGSPEPIGALLMFRRRSFFRPLGSTMRKRLPQRSYYARVDEVALFGDKYLRGDGQITAVQVSGNGNARRRPRKIAFALLAVSVSARSLSIGP